MPVFQLGWHWLLLNINHVHFYHVLVVLVLLKCPKGSTVFTKTLFMLHAQWTMKSAQVETNFKWNLNSISHFKQQLGLLVLFTLTWGQQRTCMIGVRGLIPYCDWETESDGGTLSWECKSISHASLQSHNGHASACLLALGSITGIIFPFPSLLLFLLSHL